MFVVNETIIIETNLKKKKKKKIAHAVINVR